MTTLTIEIPKKVERTLAEFVEQLGGKVIGVGGAETNKTGKAAGKLSPKEKKYIKEFDEAIEFVNLHQQGKVKAKTIDQLLNEL